MGGGNGQSSRPSPIVHLLGSVDPHAGAVPGDEGGPDGRMGYWMEDRVMRGHRWVCQNSISDGQEDGCNQGELLYSDRRLTVEKGAVRSQLRRW